MPSASVDAFQIAFPDGAVIEYEPDAGLLPVTGITTAEIVALKSITATLEGCKDGKMDGDIEQACGKYTSNGVQVDDHDHSKVQRGDNWTEGNK